MNRTPLYKEHVEAGARMVDFAGWEMPLHYGSVIGEHHAVRGRAGVFDVSHMGVLDVGGERATAWLQRLLANDVGRLDPGQALYSAMLNAEGGVVDDLIAYRLSAGYRLVVNSATREKDLRWMGEHGSDGRVSEPGGLAMLAVHGPEAVDLAAQAMQRCGADAGQMARVRGLGNFRCLELGDWLVARTGYTGERGLEIILPAADGRSLWQGLRALDIQPVGLGARDTLRLEAGMNLYGHDMDDTVSPLSANMGRSIAWEPPGRDFIGRQALEQQREILGREQLPVQVGLVLEQRGVPREGQQVLCEGGCGATGHITSGTFSPTLKRGIALARVPGGTRRCQVALRGKPVAARLVRPGFVRHGRQVF